VRPKCRLKAKQWLQLPETFSVPAEFSSADFWLFFLAKLLRIRQRPVPSQGTAFSVA
jgi:hypothetical protein